MFLQPPQQQRINSKSNPLLKRRQGSSRGGHGALLARQRERSAKYKKKHETSKRQQARGLVAGLIVLAILLLGLVAHLSGFVELDAGEYTSLNSFYVGHDIIGQQQQKLQKKFSLIYNEKKSTSNDAKRIIGSYQYQVFVRSYANGPIVTRTSPDQWCDNKDYRKNCPTNNYRLDKPCKIKKPSGIVYIKTPKTASSTIAGIVNRIAHNQGARRHRHDKNNRTVPCPYIDRHITSGWKHYCEIRAKQEAGTSFLVTSIRDPAKRAISRVFFTFITKRRGTPTDDNIRNQFLETTNRQYGVLSPGQGGFQLQYIAREQIPEYSFWHAHAPTVVQNRSGLEQLVELTVNAYNFIFISERMDESVVAFLFLLGYDLNSYYLNANEADNSMMDMLLHEAIGDVLSVADSKTAGSSFYLNKEKECAPLAKSFVSEPIRQYLNSDEWYAKNYGDYALYAAANASLDRTIQDLNLGTNRFDLVLSKYRSYQATVQAVCQHEAHSICSSNATEQRALAQQNCYYEDQGCGYPCIDNWLQSLRENNKTIMQ